MDFNFTFCTTLMFILIPKKPQYFYSLVPSQYQTIPVLLIFTLYEIYFKTAPLFLLGLDASLLVMTSISSSFCMTSIL